MRQCPPIQQSSTSCQSVTLQCSFGCALLSDDPRRAAKSAPLPLRPLDQALSRTLSLPLLPLKEAPSTRCHTPTVFFRVATIIGRLLQRVSLSHFVLSDRARSPTPLSLCRCLSSPPGRSSLITREGARWISFRSSVRLARRRYDAVGCPSLRLAHCTALAPPLLSAIASCCRPTTENGRSG